MFEETIKLAIRYEAYVAKCKAAGFTEDQFKQALEEATHTDASDHCDWAWKRLISART